MFSQDIDTLRNLLPGVQILSESDALTLYSVDETGQFANIPIAVVIVTELKQISNLVKWCGERDVRINIWGRGSSLAGGSIPVGNAITLDLSQMDRILEIDSENRTIWVESGTLTKTIQEAAKEVGLYYPVDPASSSICSIGGNVSTNAGGPSSFKYGTTRRYVLDLEMVLMDGSIVRTGANTEKFSTGLNLTQLIIGSEGILGIVTKVLLKLLPLPRFDFTALFGFDSVQIALEAVLTLSKSNIGFTTIEFMEHSALQLVKEYSPDHIIKLSEDTKSLVLVSCDAVTSEELNLKSEALMGMADSLDSISDLLATEANDQESLWEARRLIGHAVRHKSRYREVDTVVPVSELNELISYVKKVGAEYGFDSVCYGHAGNGNLHINILRNDIPEYKWQLINTEALSKLYSKVVSLGGALSGEHGIGVLNRRFMHIQYPDNILKIMRGIKQVWDPMNLLNSEKMI